MALVGDTKNKNLWEKRKIYNKNKQHIYINGNRL